MVFEAPVLGLGDLAATFLDSLGEFLGQGLDLGLGRNVLACQEDMLVERHALPFLAFPVRSGAKPLLGPSTMAAQERPKGPERAGDTGRRAPARRQPCGRQPPVQPPTGAGWRFL